MRYVAVVGLLCSVGCVVAGPATPSGRPEISVVGVQPGEARDRLVAHFGSKGWMVEKSDDRLVQVAKKSDSAAHSMLLGTPGGGDPWWRLSFALAQVGGELKIFGSAALVVNYNTRAEQSHDYSSARAGVDIQGQLEILFGKPSAQGN